MKKSYRILSTVFCVLSIIVASTGCSKEQDNEVPQAADGMCVIRFDCGTSLTKAGLTPFSETTLAKLVIYQRPFQQGSAFESPEQIYTVYGRIDKDSTTIYVTEAEGVPTGMLSLPQNKSYDILAILNGAAEREMYNADGSPRAIFGSQQGDILTGFSHGWNLLAGKTSVDIPDKQKTTSVGLGDLPHMNTAIVTEVFMDDAMFTKLGSTITTSLVCIDFSYCLPSSANMNLPTGTKSLEYQVINGSYNTSFEMYPRTANEANLTSSSETYTSDMGYILPCPQKVSGTNNVYDMTFNLSLNGYGAQLRAPQVSLPELLGGYKYTFSLKFKDTGAQSGQIDLYMSVDPWDAVSVTTEEGAYTAQNFQNIYVGSWNSVSYDTVEGAYDSEPRYFIANVGAFTAVSWSSNEGEY